MSGPDAGELNAMMRIGLAGYGCAPIAGAAAAMAVVLVAPAPPPAYVAPKGMPSVAVYLARGERSVLWNGSDALRPGDRIRLKIAPEGYSWLSVSALAYDGALVQQHLFSKRGKIGKLRNRRAVLRQPWVRPFRPQTGSAVTTEMSPP